LAAYVAPVQMGEENGGLDIDMIRSRLARDLPEYMVPSEIMVLPELPLNANGKLDRKNLPKAGSPTSKRPPIRPPRDLVEEELAALWRRVLKIEAVGLDDHFFNLGGHSLRAMNLVGGIRQKFQVELPVKAVFDHPLLSDLSLLVKEKIAEREELLRLLSEVEAMERP
jgi:acyl carrier protein